MIRLLIVTLLCAAQFLPATEFNWTPGEFGEITELAGRHLLTVTVPDTAREKINCAETEINLEPLRGLLVRFSVKVRARDVSRPRKPWNGIKVMLNYQEAFGKQYWHNVQNLSGSFAWRQAAFTTTISSTAAKGRVMLGLQDSSGTAEFDLDSLEIRPLFPKSQSTYRMRYSESVNRTPPLRGFMSPFHTRREDLAALREWNANLLRVQICRNWGKSNTDLDLAEYDRWIDGKLDHLEQLLDPAHQLGIRIVIDLHSPPGGRDNERDMRMFYEEKYAEHFCRVWEKIARRFRGHPAVWAYDLLNEPSQKRPAKCNYFELQCRAARRVRTIDPETPIIIEANEWAAPSAFHYLPVLKMENIIYEVHIYQPGAYTHQNVNNTYGEMGAAAVSVYPGIIQRELWNKEKLRQVLAPVRKFQKRHNARIYVGEFSVVAWAPGAERHLRDNIELFEEYGWDWSYHSFREWKGWSLEHEGHDIHSMRPSSTNPRKSVILEMLKRNTFRKLETGATGDKADGTL